MKIRFPERSIHRAEAERASHAYIISLVAVAGGLPLPIVNLIATFIFYLGSKRAPLFVRWHCTQAMVSQVLMFIVNAPAFWWTLHLILNKIQPNTAYFIYLGLVAIINIIEFVVTIYTAIMVNKRKHVRWVFFANLCDRILGRQNSGFYRDESENK